MDNVDNAQAKFEAIIHQKVSLQKQLERVRFARKIIECGYFDNAQATVICGWMGFSDTVFRDKSRRDKLKDFLLNENYWKDRYERKK